MSALPQAAPALLSRLGWQSARIAPLAGDASLRRFWRLTGGPASQGTVLMHDPGGAAPIRQFLALRAEFAARGLAAPRLIGSDAPAGLALLTDLGARDMAQVLAEDPAMAPTLYAAATDVITAIQAAPPPPGLPAYGPSQMVAALAPLLENYPCRPGAAARLEPALGAALNRHQPAPVLAHRDYHAENLIWRPERQGLDRIGLVDFQDAVAGHPAYDLVSLLQDARRDVPEAIERAMIERFLGHPPDADFAAAYAAQGAQRQLRIVGILAGLAQRGKRHYLALMPRVWAYLARDLAAPGLEDLAGAVAASLPPPDAALCERLAS